MNLTLGTFNVENLFLRYRLLDHEKGARFATRVDERAIRDGGGTVLMLRPRLEDFGPVSRRLRERLAQVIRENDPDILALQEVESLGALELFNRLFLDNAYPELRVIPGNDPRQIEVGILSKFPIAGASAHRFAAVGAASRERGFSRDCLVVDVAVSATRSLTVLVNHFEAQGGDRGEAKREEQAARVLAIAEERFGPGLDGGDFVVVGDLKAHWDATELAALMENERLVNALRDLVDDAGEHWTHPELPGVPAEAQDHILLSPSLAAKNPKARVWVERRALDVVAGAGAAPSDAGTSDAPRARTRPSDHCPLFIELQL